MSDDVSDEFEDIAQFVASYEHILTVLDGAITGALIAGIRIDILCFVLARLFLIWALKNRHLDKSSEHFEKWLRNMDRAWMPVRALVHYIDAIEGEFFECREFQEISFLQSKCQLSSEDLDDAGWEDLITKATNTFNWTFLALINNDANIDRQALEICILVVWFKVAALRDEVSAIQYVKVRQNWMLMQSLYDEVMDEEWAA